MFDGNFENRVSTKTVITLKKRLNNSSNDLDLKKTLPASTLVRLPNNKSYESCYTTDSGATITTMGVKFCNGSVFASGLGFAPLWMKNLHELFKPITKHSD